MCAYDLFNRKIIGYSAGRNKDADLVARAFATVKANLYPKAPINKTNIKNKILYLLDKIFFIIKHLFHFNSTKN